MKSILYVASHKPAESKTQEEQRSGTRNNKELHEVRKQHRSAKAEIKEETKNQLEHQHQNNREDTTPYRRKKSKDSDQEKKKMITRDNPPIQGKQSLAKGSSIALPTTLERPKAQKRRPDLELEEHQKA
ncbi:hypothetical protein AE52_04466 [Escherichia coli BIDMC 77]|nr:hypothetical protein AE52_04466 [Escherichia coli BIDMC 77]